MLIQISIEFVIIDLDVRGKTKMYRTKFHETIIKLFETVNKNKWLPFE